MDEPLNGQVAVVTGGGRDLGRDIALGLADAGADVAVIGRTAEVLERTAAEIGQRGRRSLAVVADLTDEADLVAAFARVVDELGPPSVLVNNASARRTARPVAEMPRAEWEETLATKLTAAMLCSREVLRSMVPAGRGTIVNISGTTGVKGSPRMSAHSVAQAGLIALTQAMAGEVGPHGIRVNTVVPSAIEGESLRQIVADAQHLATGDPDPLAFLTRTSPLGRLVQPAEVVAAVVFLASDASSGMTGQRLDLLLE